MQVAHVKSPVQKSLHTYETQPPYHHMIQPLSSFPVLPPTFTLPFSHLIYLPFIRHIKLLPGDTLVLVGLGCHNKIPKSWWLKQQKSIPHSSGGWKYGIKVWFVLRPLLLAHRHYPSYTLPWPPLCVSISHFYKDNNHTELETTHMILFYLTCFFKGCIYKYRHIPRCWKLGPQHWNMEKIQFDPQQCSFLFLKCPFPGTFMVHSFISFSSLPKSHLFQQAIFYINLQQHMGPPHPMPYPTLVFFISKPQKHDMNFLNFALFLHLHFQYTCTHLHSHTQTHTDNTL